MIPHKATGRPTPSCSPGTLPAGNRSPAFGQEPGKALAMYIAKSRSQRPDAWSEWVWLGRKGRLTDTGMAQMLRRRARSTVRASHGRDCEAGTGGRNVQFVNWQGAIFGPGSEWLWSMLQFVVVTISLIGLYRQIRLQSNASAIDQAESYARDWNAEALQRSRLTVLLDLRDRPYSRDVPVEQALTEYYETTDWSDLPLAAGNAIAGFWEKVGTLAREGHIRPELLWRLDPGCVIVWWKMGAPLTMRSRVDYGPGIYENFEWLASTMSALNRKAGLEDPG